MRFLLNPVFDIETGKLLSHDGEFFEEPRILFDRGAVDTAKQQGKQAGGVASTAGSSAATDLTSFRPTLQREALGEGGFSPTDLNNMLVSSQESVGGGNAALTGEGKLAALRTRTAGGLAPALDEAARMKGRQLSTNALGVQDANARLKAQQQSQALSQLQGLYGTDTSNQLKAMGLQSEDLQDQLRAGQQGWLQNTEGVLGTIGGLGKDAAMAYGATK